MAPHIMARPYKQPKLCTSLRCCPDKAGPHNSTRQSARCGLDMKQLQWYESTAMPSAAAPGRRMAHAGSVVAKGLCQAQHNSCSRSACPTNAVAGTCRSSCSPCRTWHHCAGSPPAASPPAPQDLQHAGGRHCTGLRSLQACSRYPGVTRGMQNWFSDNKSNQ
jgi:hypothetical protein